MILVDANLLVYAHVECSTDGDFARFDGLEWRNPPRSGP